MQKITLIKFERIKIIAVPKPTCVFHSGSAFKKNYLLPCHSHQQRHHNTNRTQLNIHGMLLCSISINTPACTHVPCHRFRPHIHIFLVYYGPCLFTDHRHYYHHGRPCTFFVHCRRCDIMWTYEQPRRPLNTPFAMWWRFRACVFVNAYFCAHVQYYYYYCTIKRDKLLSLVYLSVCVYITLWRMAIS